MDGDWPVALARASRASAMPSESSAAEADFSEAAIEAARGPLRIFTDMLDVPSAFGVSLDTLVANCSVRPREKCGANEAVTSRSA